MVFKDVCFEDQRFHETHMREVESYSRVQKGFNHIGLIEHSLNYKVIGAYDSLMTSIPAMVILAAHGS